MPNSRHQRNHRHKEEDTHNNNTNGHHTPVACAREAACSSGPCSSVHSSSNNGSGNHARGSTDNHSHQNDNAGARGHQKCCTPGACPTPDDTIDLEEPFDAVKVLCNNEGCREGNWMHKDCFEDFEQSVLAYLRSCGRARSWSEKQRLQNLWTKKGYDLAFKACDCKCGRGHLRKDLDYIPKPFNENSKKQKKHKKKNDKPMPVVSTTHKANSHSNQAAAAAHPNNNNNGGGGSHHHHGGGGGGGGGGATGNPTNTSTTTSTNNHAGAASSSRSHNFMNHASANGGGGGKKGKKSSTTTTNATQKNQDPHHKSDSNGNPSQQQPVGFSLDNQTQTTTTGIKTPAQSGIVGVTTTTTTTNGPYTLATTTSNNNNNNNVYPSPAVGGLLPGSGGSHHNHHHHQHHLHHNPQLRLRTNSVSSTGSVGSHCSSSSSSVPSSAGSPSPISSSPVDRAGDMFFKNSARKSSDASTSSTDSGSGGGGGGMGGAGSNVSGGGGSGGGSSMGLPSSSGVGSFRQRLNLSAFAALPRNKQNPYHIRMEDPSTLAYSFNASCSMAAARAPPHSAMGMEVAGGGCGGGIPESCDLETRNFVLSNLLNKKMSCARCALCKTLLPVFDRFPLLDGTFFLSPQSYDETAIQVIWEGRLQFLNAVCLGCLQGHAGVRCLACKRPWDGGTLVVGSMYTYDIFAASPCCQKRLTCKCCLRAVVDITKGLEFFSHYSQMITCPYCKANDYHFIRSLAETFSTTPVTTTAAAPAAAMSTENGRAVGKGRGQPICH